MRDPPERTTVKAPFSLVNLSESAAVYLARDTASSSSVSNTVNCLPPIVAAAIFTGCLQWHPIEIERGLCENRSSEAETDRAEKGRKRAWGDRRRNPLEGTRVFGKETEVKAMIWYKPDSVCVCARACGGWEVWQVTSNKWSGVLVVWPVGYLKPLKSRWTVPCVGWRLLAGGEMWGFGRGF